MNNGYTITNHTDYSVELYDTALEYTDYRAHHVISKWNIIESLKTSIYTDKIKIDCEFLCALINQFSYNSKLTHETQLNLVKKLKTMRNSEIIILFENLEMIPLFYTYLHLMGNIKKIENEYVITGW